MGLYFAIYLWFGNFSGRTFFLPPFRFQVFTILFGDIASILLVSFLLIFGFFIDQVFNENGYVL